MPRYAPSSRAMATILSIVLLSLLAGTASAACRVTIVGAGFGGLYSAFRLQNDTSSGYLPSEICVVEKTGRAGARALTAPPGTFPMHAQPSLGGHRWDPEVHIIVNAVIEDVLGLPSECYFRNPYCTDDGASYNFLRNIYTGDLGSSKAKQFPYFLDKWENWSKRMGMREAVEDIVVQYPFLIDALETIATTADPAVRYAMIRQAVDTLRTYAINGTLPTQATLRTFANFSSEYWEMLVSAWGEALYIIDGVDVYTLIRDALISGYGEGALRVITDAQGREVGYDAKDKALAALLQTRGVSVQYGKELTAVLRNPDSTLLLRFADGTSFSTEQVILNVAVSDFNRISRDSVVFREASPDLRRMYGLIVPTPAVKAYGYYGSSAWWHNPGGVSFSQGYVSTDTTANYYDFSDSAVECAGGVCSGYFNLAYPAGEYATYFSSASLDHNDPMVVIHANTTDPMQSRWFWDFNSQFTKSMCRATNQKQCNIPPPSIVAMGVWEDAWADFVPSNFPGGAISNATSNPAAGVYWANSDNSFMQGWAEGSAMMAERILHRFFGLQRPAWLGDQYWYTNLIDNPLI